MKASIGIHFNLTWNGGHVGFLLPRRMFVKMKKAQEALKACGAQYVEYIIDAPDASKHGLEGDKHEFVSAATFQSQVSAEFTDIEAAYLRVGRRGHVFVRGERDNEEYQTFLTAIGTIKELEEAFDA